MTTAPKFRIGDRVRTPRETALEAGTEFTITGIEEVPYMTAAECARLGFGPYYAISHETPDGIWLDFLELVEPSGYQEHKDGTLSARGESKRARHIAHIAEQDAVIRRRNERIKRQADIIDAQKEQLTKHAKQLEAIDGTHTLDKAAYQLGLGSDEALSALEIGARLLAHGFTGDDVDAAVGRFYNSELDELDDMLRTFHDAFGVPRDLRIKQGDIDPELLTRHHMLTEEVNEFLLALAKGDIVGAADALGDVIYVAAGTADRLRIPIMRVLRSIQKANMDKLDPATGKPVPHPTIPGKIGKRPGWVGPEVEIERILNEGGLL